MRWRVSARQTTCGFIACAAALGSSATGAPSPPQEEGGYAVSQAMAQASPPIVIPNGNAAGYPQVPYGMFPQQRAPMSQATQAPLHIYPAHLGIAESPGVATADEPGVPVQFIPGPGGFNHSSAMTNQSMVMPGQPIRQQGQRVMVGQPMMAGQPVAFRQQADSTNAASGNGFPQDTASPAGGITPAQPRADERQQPSTGVPTVPDTHNPGTANGAAANGDIANLPAPGRPSPGFAAVQQNQSISGQIDAQHSPNIDHLLMPQYKLQVERRHSQLIVANRRIARVAVTDSSVANYVQYSETELAIVGLELGKTDLTLWFEGDASPAIYEVTIVRDASLEEQRRVDFGRLERTLAELFPNSNVALVPVGSQVVVRGQAFDSEEASQILHLVRSEVARSFGTYGGSGYASAGVVTAGYNTGAQQGLQGGFGGSNDIIVNMLHVPGEYNIALRVIVAEVKREQLRELGVDLKGLINNGRHVVSSATGGAASNLSGIFENGEISVILKWLSSHGSVNFLAEPRLTVVSGHSASFLAGGEFAVPTIIGLGGGQNTTFRGFGTSLLVTPTVIDRDTIRMTIVPEFSQLDNTNTVGGIPGTNVRRVQTTVQLAEGQTLALAGLISRQTTTDIARIPLLGDIPIIGPRLFAGKRSTEDETELLVLVSPEIVRPMEPDEVPPLPNYYMTHPNDADLWHYGRTEGTPDTNVYQTVPYGFGSTQGIPRQFDMQNGSLGAIDQAACNVESQPVVDQLPQQQYAPQQQYPQQQQYFPQQQYPVNQPYGVPGQHAPIQAYPGVMGQQQGFVDQTLLQRPMQQGYAPQQMQQGYAPQQMQGVPAPYMGIPHQPLSQLPVQQALPQQSNGMQQLMQQIVPPTPVQPPQTRPAPGYQQ